MVKTHKKLKHKTNLPLILGIILLIVIAVMVIAIKMGFEKTKDVGIGIPIYVGSSVYGYIGVDKAVELVSLLQNLIDVSEGVHIVMFGSTGCPYCKNMDIFFTQNYRGIYKALWIDANSEARDLFYRVAKLEIDNGVSMDIAFSVPQTIVVKNGFIRAIVVGAETSRQFWDSILR